MLEAHWKHFVTILLGGSLPSPRNIGGRVWYYIVCLCVCLFTNFWENYEHWWLFLSVVVEPWNSTCEFREPSIHSTLKIVEPILFMVHRGSFNCSFYCESVSTAVGNYLSQFQFKLIYIYYKHRATVLEAILT